MLPATTWADEDLEVTMQVFDDLSSIDSSVYNTKRLATKVPDDVGDVADGDDRESEDEASGENLRSKDSPDDDFEYDDLDEDDRQRNLALEHVLEDGEEVDYDEFD
jgi:hypothetical protein